MAASLRALLRCAWTLCQSASLFAVKIYSIINLKTKWEAHQRLEEQRRLLKLNSTNEVEVAISPTAPADSTSVQLQVSEPLRS